VNVVIALAAIYAAQAMNFTTQQTLLLILAVNVAAVGAFLFGHLQDRFGPVRAIAFVLVGWLVTIALTAGA
jgi:UMF1 family MFS transporter